MDGNGDTKKRSKPYYRNIEDTLEDVGISRRQLGYWRKQGLFNPDLGPSAKNFTADDTSQLRFLKRLIEDLGLPVSTVKRLMDSLLPKTEDGALDPTCSFIDIENASLVLPAQAIERLLAHDVAVSSSYMLEKWFTVIAIELFRKMRIPSSSPRVYEARRQELFNRLGKADRLARAISTDDGGRFRPRLEKDPDLTEQQFDDLVTERDRLLKPVRQAEPDDSSYGF